MIRKIDPQWINIPPLSQTPSSRLLPLSLKANSPLKVYKMAFSSHLRMDHSLGAPLVSCAA